MSFALLQELPKREEGKDEPVERKQIASWASLTPNAIKLSQNLIT